MRKLELYIDSSLKDFELFKYAEKLLREGLTGSTDSSQSVDKALATTYFPDFRDFASILDTYQSWTDTEWTNFMVMMITAYREKGKYSAVSSVLASLGLMVKDEVKVEDVKIEIKVPSVISTRRTGETYVPEDTDTVSYIDIVSHTTYDYTKVVYTCGYKWSSQITDLTWSLPKESEERPTNPFIGDSYTTYDQCGIHTTDDGTYYDYKVTTFTAVADWTSTSTQIVDSETSAPDDEAVPSEPEVGDTYTVYTDKSSTTLYDYTEQRPGEEETKVMLVTKVAVTIENLDTPLVSKFTERFYSLLPRILWIHSPKSCYTDAITVETVKASFKLQEQFYKLIYETSFRYSDTVNEALTGWTV